jgi:hypothetical protein
MASVMMLRLVKLRAAADESRGLAVHILPRLLPLHGLPCLRRSGGLISVPGLRPVDDDMMAGYHCVREEEGKSGCGKGRRDAGDSRQMMHEGKRELSGVFPLLRYTIRLQAEAERQAEPMTC